MMIPSSPRVQKGEALLHTFSLTEFVDEICSLSNRSRIAERRRSMAWMIRVICEVIDDDRPLALG